jgi:hypothetical protein
MWERPLMFYTGRQFVAGNDPGRLDWWNSLWQYEIFRSSQKFITTVWGVGYLAEATARVAMALLFRPAIVVAVSPTIAAAVTIGLVSWTVRYGRSMRERGQRLHELARENRIS